MNKKEVFSKIIHSFYFQLALAVVVTILITTFVGHPTRVSGESMFPTLRNNQLTFINKLDHSFNRGDIVMLYYEENGILSNTPLVKRIVGVPGDAVQIIDGRVYVNDELYKEYEGEKIEDAGLLASPLILNENEFCVLGDNRNHSKDSTEVGKIKKENIVGTVITRRHK